MKCNPLRWLLGLIPLTILWWIGVLGTQSRIEADLAQRAGEALERAGLRWARADFKARDGLVGGRADEESEQRRAAIEIAKVWGVRALEDRTEVLETIKNYIWQASLGNGDVQLTGYVPNEAARKAILASARSALPRHKVDDQMKLARGAPEQKIWLGATNFAMRQLVGLKPGATAALEATGLVVQGEADSAKSYESVVTALNRSLPQGISLKSEKVIAPAVKPYTWAAALRGRQVELTGFAPSIPARDQVKATAERAFPGLSVVDRLSIGSGAPNGWQQMVTAALGKLSQLKQGNAEARDSQFSIAGLTETAETADAVRRSLRADIPSSFNVVEQIRQDPAVIAAEEARRAAEAAARRAAEEAARKKAEDDARRATAEAEARRIADLRRNETEAQSRAREADELARRNSQADAARKQAEDDARRAAEQQRQQTEAAARRKAEEDAARKKADDDARRVAEADARRRAEEERARGRQTEAMRCQGSLATAVQAGAITFQRASAELDRRSHKTLDALAQIVKGCPGFNIEVEGHTDNEGEPDRNQRLSERRANSVRDYLVRAGVPESSLAAIGYGEAKPRVANDSPANMALNRRIEFTVKVK